AWRACPKIVSSIAAGGMPERSMAARAATSPRSAADIDAKAPPNFPIGVRTAERTWTGLTEITLASRGGCQVSDEVRQDAPLDCQQVEVDLREFPRHGLTPRSNERDRPHVEWPRPTLENPRHP